MIQLAHVATGALAGRGRTGLFDALVAGLVTHAAIDLVPHGEVHDDEFELASGLAGVLALAARYGWRSPVTIGALGGVLPDMEHLPRKLGIRSTPRFPTHRWAVLHGWEHKPLAIPAWVQAVVGGAVIGALASRLTSASPR